MLVASVVVLDAIMSILDVTVVNVASNTLAKEFHTELSTIQWVETGYALALATGIPLTGWAADRFGTNAFFIATPLLPKQRPAPVSDPAVDEAAPTPVLVH